MKKYIWKINLSVTIFGESHGDCIGAVMDGLAPGIALDLDFIKQQMEKRKSKRKHQHTAKRSR